MLSVDQPVDSEAMMSGRDPWAKGGKGEKHGDHCRNHSDAPLVRHEIKAGNCQMAQEVPMFLKFHCAKCALIGLNHVESEVRGKSQIERTGIKALHLNCRLPNF